jgi:tRNA A37 threonylcarbamoyladenosine synthetase subunit TsaC/SUA5/YrdC
VPAGESILARPDEEEPVLALSMPSSHALRALCRAAGPLFVVALQRADGSPVTAADEVAALFTADDIGCVLDTGPCRGAGPTVVDCTVSPPVVRHVGALPESYVEAALMMSNRRRRWLSKRNAPGIELG